MLGYHSTMISMLEILHHQMTLRCIIETVVRNSPQPHQVYTINQQMTRTWASRPLLPLERERFVVVDVFPVLVHDLLGCEAAQGVVFGARVALLPVPHRLVVLTVHAAVAFPGAPEGKKVADVQRHAQG